MLLDLFRHAPTRENIRQFEDELDKASTAREVLRPRIQAQLTRFGGYGNGKATIGRGGWLFYTPGITAVGGPPFLDPEVQAARRIAAETAGDPPVSPDPRPAVLDFARFLAGRGIRLVVFPVPDKAGLQPLELHGRAETPAARARAQPGRGAIRGRARGGRGAGVRSDAERARGRRAAPLHEAGHALDAGVDGRGRRAARRFPRGAGSRPARPWGGARPRWRTVARTMSRVGDITDMLGLPERQTLFAPESQTIHEVQDATGAPFEPSDRGTVLLLGDSFTNVFSLEPMGWGTSAGLAPQLARALGRGRRRDRAATTPARTRPGGCCSTRSPAARIAWQERRVVVWELASRELAVGDLKPIDWSSLAAGGAAR